MSTRALALPLWLFGSDETPAAPETGPPLDEVPAHEPIRGCAVYSAENLIEAHLILDLLLEAGLPARLFNEHLLGAVGELPFLEASPRIWLIDGSGEAAARAIIDRYEARRKQSWDGTRICATCAEESPENFELCWSCREPFDT
jgi:hypothetical protein